MHTLEMGSHIGTQQIEASCPQGQYTQLLYPLTEQITYRKAIILKGEMAAGFADSVGLIILSIIIAGA